MDIGASKNVGISRNLESRMSSKTDVDHANTEPKGNVAQTNRSFLKWQEYYYNNNATYNNISYKT